jgi:hypothetical protein
MTFRISLFDQSWFFIISTTKKNLPITLTSRLEKTKTTLLQGQTYRETDRQFWIPTKHARHSTNITPTPGSVLINEDVIGPWFSSSVTSLIPSTCTRITSFPTSEDAAHKPSSPLRKSTQFCKSTTVMTVVLTHYMKLNTITTISCSIKTDNSCCVQIYCIATYRITNTTESPKQRTLLLQKIMADGRTMIWAPIMSPTNPVHTSTWFKGNYETEDMTVHLTDGRKNIKCSGK